MGPTPDTSIWEFRSLQKVYTFSRAMCWVAIDRGATLARRMGRMDLAEKWAPIAAHERAGLLSAFYIEGYLSFSLPAVLTGLTVPTR